MTHEERMDNYGTWPSPPFTDKASYLQWVADWKAQYKRISEFIRAQKLAYRLRQSTYDRASRKAGISPGAWHIPDDKLKALKTFRGELLAAYPEAIQAQLKLADEADKEARDKRCIWSFEATKMLYDRHRAKATSWEMAKHVRAQAVAG